MKRWNLLFLGLGLLTLSFLFAALYVSEITPKREVNVQVATKEYIPSIPNAYDSQDIAIFLYMNEEEKTACFQNARTGKRYTLNYSGATYCIDRYGQNISFSQIKNGTMSEIKFLKETKNLTYIKESTDCICYRECDTYDINLNNSTVTLFGQLFKFNRNLTVMSGDKEICLQDIDSVDTLTFWGYNDQIYSIGVDKGHGFLTLVNDSYFTDGWVEVGEKVIKKITNGMKLVVPEGTYNVSAVKNGSTGNEVLTFNRGEVVEWDLGFVEIEAPKIGKTIFTVTPITARVYIDGDEVDTSLPVENEYGVHQVTAVARGYKTFSKYMKVGTAISNITIDLEKQETTDEEKEEDKDIEEKTDKEVGKDTQEKTETDTEKKITTDTDKEIEKEAKAEADKNKDKETTSDEKKETVKETDTKETNESDKKESDTKNEVEKNTTNYKVHIDKPEGVEIYADGNYIGIAPVDFAKKSGNVVITLRQNGYKTRSYALEIDSEEKDTTFSFSELEKIE